MPRAVFTVPTDTEHTPEETAPVISAFAPSYHLKTADGHTSVLFEDITFRRISGAGRRAEQIVFDCSPLAPCTNITVDDVRLKANGTAACHHANVSFRRSAPSQCEPSEPHSV